MAGRLFVDNLFSASRIVEKRSPQCIPEWVPTTNCQGTCQNAYQTFSQFNCTEPPFTQSISCNIPCQCFASNLPVIDPSVVTCGNCDGIQEGFSCFFYCLDPTAILLPEHVNEIKCLPTGWAQVPQNRLPLCSTIRETCPPIYDGGGVITINSALSKCVNANEGDVCESACGPGFYNPDGWFSTRCSRINGSLSWNRQMRCACQSCGTINDKHCSTNHEI